MKKLKICILSIGVFPDHKDGSAKYIRGLYDTLKSHGHEVKLITAKWDDGFNDPDIFEINIQKSRFLWVFKYYSEVRKYLKKNKFDIIQVNGSRASIPLLFGKWKFITLIHDMGPFEANFSKIPILKWLERKNAQKASKIITNSEITKKGIVEYMHGKPDKIYTVYCGYDDDLKPYPEEAEKEKENLGIKGPVIYYVGRIAFYKGVENIITAYKIAKNTIFDLNLIIGGKPTLKMKDKYFKLKKENPDVHFLGLVPDEKMAIYYSLADVFCTYSWASEGFGITPIESLACGTPVICSDMPAYKEILQNNAIFVPKQNPELLAKEFVKFFSNPNIGKKMVLNAQDHIKKYTWETVTKSVEKVYYLYLDNQKLS